MRFSKKSRYGIRALIDLAINSADGQVVALNTIAERNNISQQYLEQIFSVLRKSGIVVGIKGSQGGYLLSRDPEYFTVAEIIESLEGSYHIEPEEEHGVIDNYGAAGAIQNLVINKVNDQTDETLKKIKLSDLKNECLKHMENGQNMYYI